MRNYFAVILILGSAIVFAGCAAKKGEFIESSKLCDPSNDGKYVETRGVILPPSSVFCSNIGSSRVNCPFDISDKAGGEKLFRVDIGEGTGANTLDKLNSGYKKTDIKIRDNSGAPVALGSDNLQFTGKLSVTPDRAVCFVNVDTIEQ